MKITAPMQNLRDKLLKAGLVSEEQAKKAAEAPPKQPPSQAKRNERRPPPRPSPASGPMITVRPQPLQNEGEGLGGPIPKLPPLPGSKAHQRLESKKQVEHDRQLRELVHANEVPLEPGDTVFYFVTRKQKLRRLELSKGQAEKLEKGELAVVERPEPAQIEHSLVAPHVAEQAQALSPKAVRFFNRPGQPVGFLTEDDIRSRQEREAAGVEEHEDAAPEAPEAAAPAVHPELVEGRSIGSS